MRRQRRRTSLWTMALGRLLKEAGGTQGGENAIRRGRLQVRAESRSEGRGYIERQGRPRFLSLLSFLIKDGVPQVFFFPHLKGAFLPLKSHSPDAKPGNRGSVVSEVCGTE